MKKIIDCAYLIGILVVIAFTAMKSSMPGILIEYQYHIMGVALVIVLLAFWYSQKLKTRR